MIAPMSSIEEKVEVKILMLVRSCKLHNHSLIQKDLLSLLEQVIKDKGRQEICLQDYSLNWIF